MKRRLFPLLILVLAVVCLLGLASCSGNAYKIEFYDGETLLYTFLVPKGGSLEEIPDVPERAGYTGEWSVTDFDEVSSGQKVFAIYTKSQFTVTFIVDDEVYRTVVVNKNSRVNNVPPVPEKEGYTGEWSVGDLSLVDRDIDVYAIYTEVATKVTFVADDRVLFVSDVSDGVTAYVPAVPTVQGKNYSSKWVLDSADGTEEPDFNAVTSSVTVYAHYYLTLSLVGGEDDTLCSEIDAPVSLPAYGRKTGYDFLGWYADSDYVEKIDFPHAFNENTTIYARWLHNAFDEGFQFSGSVLTGYTGSSLTPVAPYKYEDGSGNEVFVTSVGDNAFEGSDLTSITLPSTITEIGEQAFHNAYDLTTVSFADGSYVRSIGVDAFCECRSLTSFPFSKFTSEIGSGAFYGCESVTSYPGLEQSALTVVPEEAFYENSSVTAFRLPASLTEIGLYAFADCSAATFSFAGTGVTTVRQGAFTGCAYLSAFTQPNLTFIGAGAFAGCGRVNSLTITSDKALYSLFGEDVGTFFYTVSTLSGDYGLPKTLRTVYVTANPRTDITSAGTLISNAFYGAASVKAVTVGSGVKVIEDHAFCLEDPVDTTVEFAVTLPSGLVEIGDFAFSGRQDMKSISLPDTLESVGERAFSGLTALTTVAIPDNNRLSFVGAWAFEDTAWFDNATGVVKLGRVALGASDRVGKYELSGEDFSGIRVVAPLAFSGNNRLNKIVLSSTVTEIGDYAFADTILSEIVLNAGCSVGQNILAGSENIARLTLGASKTVQELFGQAEFTGSVAYVKDAETYYLPSGLTRLTIVADDSTEIKTGAFTGFAAVTQIVVAEGITKVYDGAFTNNAALQQISFPASLLSVGDGYEAEESDVAGVDPADILSEKTGVFTGSESLTTVTFAAGSTLSTIYGKSFFGTSIAHLSLPSSVSNVGAYAFADTALTDITFAETEELSLGAYAFARTSGIDTFDHYALSLPIGLTSIGQYAFADRSGITSVAFPAGLAYIGDGAFVNCSVSDVTLPSSVLLSEETTLIGVFKNNPVVELEISRAYSTDALFGGIPAILNEVNVLGGEIQDEQFRGVTSLQTLVLRDVTAIGDYAFYGCTDLATLEIPSSVLSIGEYAFAECTGLLACVFSYGSTLETLGSYAFAGDVLLAETLLPDTVTADGNDLTGVFSGCVALQNVNVPTSLVAIGDDAFRGCASLSSIAIPEGVETVGDYAFAGCAVMEFENVRFDCLTTIGAHAFNGCALLHAVKAENINTIGEHAFDGCEDLKEITLINTAVSALISAPEKIVSVDVSSNSTGLASGAFSGCTSLIAVSVFGEADTVNAVLQSIAGQDRNGAKVFVPAEIFDDIDPTIKTALAGALFTDPSDIAGEYVYDENTKTAVLTGLTEAYTDSVLYLPSFVTYEDEQYELVEIGADVFKNNLNVAEVILPYTIRKVGNSAFSGCENLSTLRFELGSRLTHIGDWAFAETESLTYIDLPDSLTTIGAHAFEQSGLQTIDNTVNSRLTSIGAYAFAKTASLTEVTFYGPLREIGERAFWYSGIVEITFSAHATVTDLTDYVFADCYSLSAETVTYLQEHYVTDDTTFYKMSA